jgi:hypothetical protein
MGNALNSFGNSKSPNDAEPLNDQLSISDNGQQKTEGQAASDATEMSDPYAAHRTGAAFADRTPDHAVNEDMEGFRIHQVLEQGRLAAGDTGAAFGNPEFLKDEPLRDPLSESDRGQQQPEGQTRSDGTESSDPFAAHHTGPAFAERTPDLAVDENMEELRLNQVLELACLATGATGAAIALIRGEEIVCCATAGPDAPSLGVRLDPHAGLSGLCIQTRQLQHCTDMETDPRVNPEASRILGVRSIAVLPLMDGDEFFGIFEILSPRPHAFGKSDLRNLQALSERVVENRRQGRENTAPLPQKGSGSFVHSLERVVPQDNSHASESDSVPPLERAPRRNDRLTLILAVLVLVATVLMGILVGSRFGWLPEIRGGSRPHRANRPSKTGGSDHTVIPAKELATVSAPAGSLVPKHPIRTGIKGPAQPPRDGVTIEHAGLIFYMPPSASSRTRGSQTSQPSPDLKADPEQR